MGGLNGQSGLSLFKNALVEQLRNDYRLSGIGITVEYPQRIRDYPLGKPWIAVGIDSVETNPSMGGYIGACAETGGELRGQLLSVTARFDIFTPVSGRHDPYGIMDIIIDTLILSQNGPGFTKLWGESVTYDRAAEANRLTVRAGLKAAVTAWDDSPAVRAFRLQKREETAIP